MSSPVIEHELQEISHSEEQAAAFQALEQRVLRAIDLLRKERELRAAAELRANTAEEQGLELELKLEEQTGQLNQKTAHIEGQNSRLAEHGEHIKRLEGELSQLQGERDQVRQRVERLLQHLDEFTGA